MVCEFIGVDAENTTEIVGWSGENEKVKYLASRSRSMFTRGLTAPIGKGCCAAAANGWWVATRRTDGGRDEEGDR